MALHIDYHLIQTVPPSNLNRDDTGSPKTAMYGGVRRARVSSQAWKKASRSSFKDHLDESDLGVRTKRAVELLSERILKLDAGLGADGALARAEAVVKALGIKTEPVKASKKADAEPVDPFEKTSYLVFWSNRQLDRLANLAVQSEKPTPKAAKEAADTDHGIEVALFGRMVADAPDLNVDASVQVAHALSTHGVEIEQDYFTAVDDENPEEESGAGMIGTVEFDSATLYRYATVNVDGLRANLGEDDAATVRAIEAFTRAFVTSMPTGKQNTFANRTVPDAVVVTLRTDQPVSLVGAFEEAVEAAGSHVRASVAALVRQYRGVYSMLDGPEWVRVARSTDAAAAVDELASPVSLTDLVSATAAEVRNLLASA